MSELSEIRSLLTSVQTDVRWIREGMERGTKRMDGHDKRLRKVETRQYLFASSGGALGVIVGAVLHRLGLA